MDNEELMIDVVSFTDDDGNEFEMELIDEFEHKGERYVVLADVADDCEHEEGEACDHDHAEDEESLYIMRVEATEDGEDFMPVEEEILQELVAVVEERLFADDDED